MSLKVMKTCTQCSRHLVIQAFKAYHGSPHADYMCVECRRAYIRQASRKRRAQLPQSTMATLPEQFRQENKQYLAFLKEYLESSTKLPVTLYLERHRSVNNKQTSPKKNPHIIISEVGENIFLFSMKFDYGRFPLTLQFSSQEIDEGMQTIEESLAQNFLTFEPKSIEELKTYHLIGF